MLKTHESLLMNMNTLYQFECFSFMLDAFQMPGISI